MTVISIAPPPVNALAELDRLFDLQHRRSRLEPPRSLERRRQDLADLRRALLERKQRLAHAIARDFGNRAHDETYNADILPVVRAARHAERALPRWVRPSRRRVSLIFQSARARVVYQPVGVVGILAPWNFPVLLSLGPLVSALAAGNRVMLKLSEFTPATNTVLRDVIGACFSEDHVAIVTGEVDVSIAFSRKPFDHLVFTGSEQTAHHVMRAAARNLTPVTLELGGKTPALIDPAADLREAVARIAFGKALNAGQSRAAPDYILCPRERVEEFVELFQERFARLYPSLCDNPDYSNIINRHHYRRLQRMLADARELGARLIEVNSDGCSFEGSRILPVYLILNVTDDMRVMQEELFGPLLPIVGYDEFDSALRYINSRPRALALYYFGRDRDRRQRVLEETTSGGVCINDTQVHAAVETIPFGGVGASGLGRYTSREGFETFSNVKAVFERLRPNGAALLYPPYGGLLQRLVRRILLR